MFRNYCKLFPDVFISLSSLFQNNYRHMEQTVMAVTTTKVVYIQMSTTGLQNRTMSFFFSHSQPILQSTLRYPVYYIEWIFYLETLKYLIYFYVFNVKLYVVVVDLRETLRFKPKVKFEVTLK